MVELDRVCMVCETPLQVTITDKTVEGGHYFGTDSYTLKDDELHPDDEYLRPNVTDDGELELWECDDCFQEAAAEFED